MARRHHLDHDWDDEPEWDEDANDAEEDEDTEPCPYCGREIYTDAYRCPHCENYLSEEDRPPARKPRWVVLGVILCLLIVYVWLFV